MVIQMVFLSRDLNTVVTTYRETIAWNPDSFFGTRRAIRQSDIPDYRVTFYNSKDMYGYLRGSMYQLKGKERKLLASFGD